MTQPKRLIIAITGATGALYGVRLLQVLHTTPDIETHFLLSEAGALSLHQELNIKRKDIEKLAHTTHHVNDISAAIAHGFSNNLITRSADVILKERRRLVLMVRETPFNLAHLKNMIAVTEMGGIIYPPLPNFYHRPRTIEEMVDHTVGRILDLFHIPHTLAPRWEGLHPELNDAPPIDN